MREQLVENRRIAIENELAAKQTKIRRLACAGCTFTAKQPLLQVQPYKRASKTKKKLDAALYLCSREP